MEKNYRNISYNGDNFVPYESGVPTALTEKWQSKIAEDAKRFGFIALDHLTYIFAADKQYTQLLPGLWFEYQCDLRGPKVPKVANARERIGPWFDLFERWGHGRVRGVPRKNDDPNGFLKDIIYLRLYRYNKVKGELELYDRSIEYSGHSDPKVKLEDLKEYLNEIIKIPLPELLYPKPSSPSQPEQEPKTKAQKYPEEVIDLLREVKPEIEMIYSAIRKVGFEGTNIDATPTKWKEKAKEMFTEKKDNFELIKYEYLEDQEIYELNPGHEKRDFIGNLLKKIVEDKIGEQIGGQGLYKKYIEIER